MTKDMDKIQDKLDEMFYHQLKLQEKLGTFELAKVSPSMKQHYIDKMILAIHEEASEILRETISKHVIMPFGWKRKVIFSEDNYRTEIIDLWHFVMNLWLINNGTADEFFELYMQKNRINIERQDEGY